MAIPKIVCSNDLILSFSASAQIANLSAISDQLVASFTWTILSVPPGSTALIETRGNFVNGIASTGSGLSSNVNFITDGNIEGTYVIQCTAVNSSGEENSLDLDKENAQQNIVIRTETLALSLPNDFQYDWALYNNNNLLILENVSPTSDEKNALSGTSGSPSSSNKYVTNSDSRLSDTRIPTTHNLAGSEHNSDTLANLNSKISDATLIDTLDSRLSDSRNPIGSAGGDLSGTYPNPSVAAITETGGPTSLTIGNITDGQFLQRSGSTIISSGIASNTPWFVWDDTDITLSQFDTVEDGTSVTLSTWSVVNLAGVNWIQAVVTATGSTKSDTVSFLPISATPPSPDYEIRAEIVFIDAVLSNAEAGLMVRQLNGAGIGTGYSYHINANSGTPATLELLRHNAAEAFITIQSFGDEEIISQNDGLRCEFGIEADEILKVNFKGGFMHKTGSSVYGSAGRAGLLAGANTAGSTTRTILFRNIRCFSLPRGNE